ncbi:hypothetical protein LTR04_003524, partial [Oleoguttula sp. CCFEE 6159]
MKLRIDSDEAEQQEAVAGRRRPSGNRDNLATLYRDNRDVRPPYVYDQITETAVHREVLSIFQNVGDLTRPYYDLGKYRTDRTKITG